MITAVGTTVTAFIAVCLVRSSNALEITKHKLEGGKKFHAFTEGLSELFQVSEHYALEFTECKDLTLEECKTVITRLQSDGTLFGRNVDNVNYEVDTLQQPGAQNAHVIGIVTDMEGTHVTGYSGDGIIRYYNPNFARQSVWCISNEPCTYNQNRILEIDDKCCFNVGPWDCDNGNPKTVDECCDMIKSSVPGPNTDGKEIECHIAHPLGSIQNPIDYNRIKSVVAPDGHIVISPKNERL